MSKSLVYTVNSATQNLTDNGVINPGMVIRRFGPNLGLSGNAIQVIGNGYYKINANFTIAPTATTPVTITAYLDGVAIPGAVATGTVSTADNSITLPINVIFRLANKCCNSFSILTFVISDTTSNISNAAIIVEKI